MILESAQMLCTAHHHYNLSTDVPYKKLITITHQLYGLGKTKTITDGYTTT